MKALATTGSTCRLRVQTGSGQPRRSEGSKGMRFCPVACPLWVKNGHGGFNLRCPLCPQKRTLADTPRMSTLGCTLDFRNGSKVDVTLSNFDVRFTPESRHSPTRSGCLLWANTGSRCSHSITSSAATRRAGGTLRPRAFAVFKFRIVSNFVGACNGRSAGFSPLRMRSMYPAARRNCSPRTSP